jgi:hypothetical protein
MLLYILQVYEYDSPVECLPHELPAPHGLHEAQHFQVWHIWDLLVCSLVEVLLGHQHTLLEEVLVDQYAVLLQYELQREAHSAQVQVIAYTKEDLVSH